MNKTMKAILLLLLFIGAFSLNIFALDFQKTAPLYEHLCEVNNDWKKITPDAGLLVSVSFPSDRERIQKHLELVENELRSRETSLLSASQKANRTRHLDVLHGYWLTGVFPTNHYHTDRRPYFRDNFEVLCAVGFLMWEDGQREIVDRINQENNFAYIAELAGQYPELGAWARENGFTLSELAWIQPEYEVPQPDLSQWGNGQGLNPGGRINAMISYSANRLIVAGYFSEIQGVPANNIAEWDGAQWHPLGDGVTGEVFCLDYYFFNNTLYIGGDFYLPSDPMRQNVAQYKPATGIWTGLQTGDMEGRVLAIKRDYYGLFIGGDFQKIDGVTRPYLAQYYFAGTGLWSDVSGRLSVNAPVRSIEHYYTDFVTEYLLFGGDFTEICTNCPPEEQQQAGYLAYWSGNMNNWEVALSGCPHPVSATAKQGGYLYTANKNGIQVLDAGIWSNSSVFGIFDSLPYGFLTRQTSTGSELYAFGGVSNYVQGIGYWGRGLVQMNGPSATGVLIADSTVRAAVSFQGDIYLAGDFTKLHNTTFNGLAILKKTTSGASNAVASLPFRVSASTNHLRFTYESLEHPTQLIVYDLQGRRLAQQTLPPGDGEWILDAQSGWASGLYVWHLENSAGTRVGKWVVAN